MTTDRDLAARLAPELLVELYEAAADSAANEDQIWEEPRILPRLRNAVRNCAAIIGELRAGRVVLVPANSPASGADRPTPTPDPPQVVAPKPAQNPQ